MFLCPGRKTPHPRATDARSRGIKFPISEAVAATLGEETDTLVDVVEPFLLQNGLLARTRSGRMVTARAYKHLGVSDIPPQEETGLFDEQ